MNLSTHFTLEEFTRSQTAHDRQIDNTLPGDLYDNAFEIARLMEKVREALTMLLHRRLISAIDLDLSLSPVARELALDRITEKAAAIRITSGYRCPELNTAVGGSASSQHMQALAADFVCPAFGTRLEVAEAIRDSDIQFDQLIYEGNWVHLGTSRGVLRREVLTKIIGGYAAGIYKELPRCGLPTSPSLCSRPA